MKKLSLAVASVLALIASPALAVEHLVNGGFETGDFTGFTETDPYTVDEFHFNYVGVDGAYSNSGSFSAYMGTIKNDAFGAPPDRIDLTQTFATVAGNQYDFSFYLANGGDFVIPEPDNSFTAAFNGTNLLTLTNVPSSLYTLFSYRVTATGTNSTIAFSTANISSFWSLDDVSVLDATVDVPAVPEPATWAMMLVGFVIVGGAMRQRANTAKACHA